MHPLATLPLAQVELHWDCNLSGGGETRTRQLRGALGTAFHDDDVFHQHDPATGKPYPAVRIVFPAQAPAGAPATLPPEIN